ncbi:hypothetical protein [Simiduia aestuariiviva]|uniref:Uncharacterized protein n=1 Tax=Simiduia aestuariiviva TaxID=1510459 RepID=A0A839URK0_9GAMM|nr:hypothetical protein [Simiduia aestuariiviva]MBB3169341.1 hypothetical protein [Simiduia aestuariiviva]
MKYFKFWVKDRFIIKIADHEEEISVLAGSNVSVEDARREATNRAKKIEERIAAGESRDSYQVAIKEHVSEVLDDANVVTVCRYGAKVLNTSAYTILDLDDYPVSFFDFFRPIRKLSKKDRIVAKFEQNIKKTSVLGTDFRIYETQKGIRVIGKKYIDPSSQGYTKLMRGLGVDWLYIDLSKKQNCYRARLTPKPYRMKHQTIKIKSPLDCTTQDYEVWDKSYSRESQNFSVVKLVKTLGSDFSQEQAIKKHDDACNLHGAKKLA